MGPTRAWQEPPAKHGFATQRERLLWQHGWDAVMGYPADRLAVALESALLALGRQPQVMAAQEGMTAQQWVYPFLAGMSRAVGERDWRH